MHHEDQITCNNEDPPANGKVTYTGFYEGDRATYFCDDKYTLAGDKVRVCQSDGEWSGVPPLCISSGNCLLSVLSSNFKT